MSLGSLVPVGLALLAACSPMGRPDGPFTPRDCRLRYRACADHCQAGGFSYVGRGVWVGDWRQMAGCERRCADDARQCSGALERTRPSAVRPPLAPTPDQAVGVWVAEYFMARDLGGDKRVRLEPVIDLREPPFPDLPRIYSVRWSLRERLEPGAYRLIVQTDGELEVSVDGQRQELRPVQQEGASVPGPPLLRTEDITLGTGRLVVVRHVTSGQGGQCHAVWLRVGAGDE